MVPLTTSLGKVLAVSCQLPGALGWSSHTWPLHVALASHNIAAGSQEPASQVLGSGKPSYDLALEDSELLLDEQVTEADTNQGSRPSPINRN